VAHPGGVVVGRAARRAAPGRPLAGELVPARSTAQRRARDLAIVARPEGADSVSCSAWSPLAADGAVVLSAGSQMTCARPRSARQPPLPLVVTV
jgi:hypothetical protein